MTFQERLKKLNKEQRKAVETTEGPVMVIAGPGTGKTEIIGMRTAYICKEVGIAPENILITTFTESGAQAIKDRLLDIMGTDAYKVEVCTLHGFCSRVIGEFPEKFIFARGLRHISEIEAIGILRNIVDELPLKNLVVFDDRYHYVNEIKKRIQELKREDISPEYLEKHLELLEDELKAEYKINPKTGKPPGKWQDKEKLYLKNKELASIYREYQKVLKEKGFYDYDDMIVFVVKKFKEDDELLANFQERYLYIMLDEYQDTNKAQNEIVELLTSFQNEEKPNIFVVGDDDQSIYRFQGASLENILFFEQRYGVKEPIVLKENYRSTQNILDASFSLVEKNKNRVGAFIKGVDKKLNSNKKDNKKINLIEFSSENAEKFYIFKKISDLQKEGKDLCEIAIFTRTNGNAHEMAEFLTRRDIPVVFGASNNILDGRSVRMFFDLIVVIENPYDDAKLLNVMFFDFFGIDPRDVYKVSRYLNNINHTRKDKLGVFDILQKTDDSEFEFFEKEKLKEFLGTLLKLKKESVSMTFSEYCEHIFKESGFLSWILKRDDKITNLRHISSLFSEIKSMNMEDKELDAKKFLEKINLFKDYKVAIKEESFILEKEGVRVMTAHKAKGLEFEYVFIFKSIDGLWGNRRVPEKLKLPPNLLDISSKLDIEKNEDERRLFFVALTRAKNELFLTYAKEYAGGKDEAFISQFIEEMDNSCIEKIEMHNMRDSEEEFLDKQLQGSDIRKESENEYLKVLLEGYKLSVTNLNDYLKCPKLFKFKNLLRVPETKKKQFALGTAYHSALEKFFLEFKNTGVLPSREFLVVGYRMALEREILTPRDKEELLKVGEEGIGGYYDKYKSEMKIPEAVEYNFAKNEIFLDDVHLTGKIDKIEKLNDNDAKVIDYKTGSMKSKNEIDGNTKNSDGGLKRQIVFYKILCDLDPKFKYNMTQGELDFAQGKDGKYKKEIVEVSESDVEELKSLIKEVYSKIKNLEFDCADEKGYCKNCEEYGA